MGSEMCIRDSDWAKAPHKATGGKTVGIYLGALGYGYNRELLAKKGLPAPKCWNDLLHSAYKDEIMMAYPAHLERPTRPLLLWSNSLVKMEASIT